MQVWQETALCCDGAVYCASPFGNPAAEIYWAFDSDLKGTARFFCGSMDVGTNYVYLGKFGLGNQGK